MILLMKNMKNFYKMNGWGVYEQTYLGGEWMDNDKPDFWQPLPLPPNVS